MSFDVTPPPGERSTPPARPKPPPVPPRAAPPPQPAQPVPPPPTSAPPVPPSQGPSRGMKVLAVIGALTVIGWLVNASNESRVEDDAASRLESPAVPDKPPSRIGQPVQAGAFQVTVISTRTVPAGQFLTPPPGSLFYGVLIEVRNGSNETEIVSSVIGFDLRDGNGQRMQQTITENAGPSLDGNVPPGASLRGEIVYEVPTSATGLQMIVNSSEVFGDSEVILLY